MNWSMSYDACKWDGVTCNEMTRDVIGIDLSCGQLVGPILPNSSLFQLSRLQTLNLAFNDFSLSNQISKEFGRFAGSLVYLNLSDSGFSGKIPSEILNLNKLVTLDLSYNFDANLEHEMFKFLLRNLTQLRDLSLIGIDISSILPMNLSTSLRRLEFSRTGLLGELPEEVFHLPNLEVLRLSGTTSLTGKLPKVKWGSSNTLRRLDLGFISLIGGLPDSIGYLKSLNYLLLPGCNLSGSIPRSIENLTQLVELGLFGNHLTGQIPNVFAKFNNLRTLFLGSNNLNGSFPSSVVGLKELLCLSLSGNSLTGPVPANLTGLGFQKLVCLYLENNSLNGTIPSWLFSLPSLKLVSLHSNMLAGPIPKKVSQLVNLMDLDLSSNNLSGVLKIGIFSHLKNLETLSLSQNRLLIRSTVTLTMFNETFPKLRRLSLSSCKIKEFPYFIRAIENLEYLDLSNNQIHGQIPHWMGSKWRDSLYYLNISHNYLTSGLEQIPWNYLEYLDLRSNLLEGSLPWSICNSSYLDILNLSNNSLSGVLPNCLGNLSYFLSVFDLRMNHFHGEIPSMLSNFSNLRSLSLCDNNLDGTIPRSFVNFKYLEVLDLGNNQINDIFPHWLETLPNLQVLVLKSNRFHGPISNTSKTRHPFPSLRIIDLSCNEFSGFLPVVYFKNFQSMMIFDVNTMILNYMGNAYYSDSVTMVVKGVEIEFVRILTVLTTIDLSSNKFEGEIPSNIGNLTSLRNLNLSHNCLIGHIPSLLGSLSMLESLDISSNKLVGEIPQQLVGLGFLELLNLSQNHLSGPIPLGNQFNTFQNDSYGGNFELCGLPLSKKCESETPHSLIFQVEDDSYFMGVFTWESALVGYGFGIILGFVISYLMILAGKPKWFTKIVGGEPRQKVRRIEIRRLD